MPRTEEKYKYAIDMLIEIYGPPCEMFIKDPTTNKSIEFMNLDFDRCNTACGVDDEVFRECWNRYIEKAIKEEKKEK